METIDLTPTWREILPALLAIYENGDKEIAMDEFMKMAGAADRYISLAKQGRISA